MKSRKKMTIDDFPELEMKRMQVIKGGFQFYDPTYNGGNLPPVDIYPGGGNNDPWGGQYDPWANGGSSSVDYPGDYGNNGGYDNSNNTGADEPWLRDSNGNLVATRTSTPRHIDNTYNNQMLLEEYELNTGKETFKVYKVISVLDPETGERRPPYEREKSNCLGYALADGDFWIIDSPLTQGVDEGKLNDFVKDYYSEVSKNESNFVAIYDETGDIVHAGKYNPADGTYEAKGGVYNIVENISNEETFKQPYGPNGPTYWGEGYQIKYFK
ncbi:MULTISPECIES: hypothetical protein [Sphingobacterium]|uniref:hypothetical protein n=1 Tax=Sphingobacterium TaxID=28453 RepID=UPI00257E3130|nr:MULTISPECIES: hypothetical protein [Sphingobacterium]